MTEVASLLGKVKFMWKWKKKLYRGELMVWNRISDGVMIISVAHIDPCILRHRWPHSTCPHAFRDYDYRLLSARRFMVFWTSNNTKKISQAIFLSNLCPMAHSLFYTAWLTLISLPNKKTNLLSPDSSRTPSIEVLITSESRKPLHVNTYNYY